MDNRLYAVIPVAILFVGVIIVCILTMFGKCGMGLKRYWHECTNLKEENKKEQKYVVRMYGIEGLILTPIAFAVIMCFIFEQMLAAWILFAITIIVLIVIEICLKFNKKFQAAKKVISESERWKEYLDKLRDKNNEEINPDISIDENIVSENKVNSNINEIESTDKEN